MTIRFLTQLADKAGTKELQLDLGQKFADVRELMKILAERNRPAAEAVMSGDILAEDVYILINGRHISSLDGMDSTLSDKDELAFVPVTEAG